MSVLIKGMEMPKDGCHHMICIYADGTVSTGGRVYIAIPVPPHGDLIDRDGAVRDLRMDYAYAAAKIVALQPTIIPAEETLKEATNDQNNS